ncbi:MAG: ribonuclease III family protein [Candidatus Methanosuratincola sp.]
MGDVPTKGMYETIQALSKDKGLSRLGDSFVNLIYSSAKSRSSGKPFGGKVPDKILSRSLSISGLKAPARLNHGERGDIVEGALAYAWTKDLLTLEEAVGVLEAGLRGVTCESRREEEEVTAKAFSVLFLTAMRRICGQETGA